MISELSQKALAIATTQIGNHEQPAGSNGGPEVNQYLQSVGLTPGNFWCASFVYWCFQKAAVQLKVMTPVPRTGHCLDMANKTPERFHVKDPQPGDVFILDLGRGHGHTGMVAEIDKETGNFRAVEGNSNNDGSHNGEMVCVPKWRKVSSAKTFLRF